MISRHKALPTVLVTGCPRSGTTAIGDILAASPGAQYLYEPLNYVTGDKQVAHFFEVPESFGEKQGDFARFAERVRTLDLNMKRGVSMRDPAGMAFLKRFTGGRSRVSLLKCKLTPGLRTLVWKDPFASFATHFFSSQEYPVPTIVTVRSIYATAASFKRLGWGFDLISLYDRLAGAGRRPVLPRGLLNIPNGAINGAALWILLYSDVATALEEYPQNIRIVNTDEVIRDPLRCYEKMFDWLGMDLTPTIHAKIKSTYRVKTDAPEIPGQRAHTRNRDLSKASSYWQSVLTSGEVETIDELVRISRNHATLQRLTAARSSSGAFVTHASEGVRMV